MKKYILMPVLASVAMVGFAQDFDTDPTVRIDNPQIRN